MNEQQAIYLIKETFENPFDKSQFINFISNLLKLKQNEILNEHPYSGNYIPEAYRQYINSLYRIAKYEDDSGKKIDVVIVRLEKETSLERARSMQRNFIAWYLKGSRGGILKDAALVAFVSPDDEDWRFSFVKIQYLFKDNKVAEMLSSALRYSFLVGKNEISYTAQTQLRPFLLDDINKPSLKMLEQSFSVEKVSDKFFKEYKFLYDKALLEFNDNDVFKTVLKQNSNLSVDLFVRKLLGQVVFLYFLQKKGWLGIIIDEPGWKAGNRKFIRWAFEDCKKKNKNYFDRFLQPLFYTGFNKKEELFQYDEFQFKIPFLNGGLFEELFHWESAFINPANTLFSNNEIHKDGSIGTGILDIFDRYNFTIDENTAFEKEIAVDPEMLGKVFENLLPDNLRKGKGAYYTPREIVAYMTKESLVNYLISKIAPADSDDKSKIEEKVRRLFDYKDLYINKKNKDKYGKEFEQQFYEMLDIVEDVNKHLQAIKIVDPACGSGAFPMGILLEIVSLREYIENEFLDNKILNYQLKKETIQNSIYGVDIDPGAVEIAKLRFWLSLVVDAKEPEPLPNLDYKIMQGNSLIESFEGIDLSKVMADKNFVITQIDPQMDLLGDNGKQQKFIFSDKRKETITNLKYKYYLETDPNKKKEIHQKIDKIVLEHIHYNLETEKEKLLLSLQELKKDLRKLFVNLKKISQIKQLLKTDKKAIQIRKIKKEIFEIDIKFKKLKELEKSIERPYFLWHLFFSEIFEGENEGFDIVIANPPYIDSETMVKESPEYRKKINTLYTTASGNWDIYIPFWELGLKLLSKSGNAVYITPNKWLAISYGKELRKLMHNYYYQIGNCNKVNVFEAGNSPVVVFISKNNLHDKVRIDVFDEYYKIQESAYESKTIITDKNWGILLAKNINLIIKINKNRSIIENNYYAENPFTVSEAYEIKNIMEDLDKSTNLNTNKFIKFINTGTIEPYYSLWGKKLTTYIKTKYYKPIINKKNFKEKFPKRYKQMNTNKIIISGMRHFEALLDDNNEFVAGKSTVILKSKNDNLKIVLGILNSHLITFFIKEAYNVLGIDGGINFTASLVENLPFPNIDKILENRIINLIENILIITKAEDYLQNPQKQAQVKALEQEIDQIVYELYELTPEEIKIVEGEN